MEIPKIGFGTYRLKDDTTDSVLHALTIGYTHIDTAPLYKNEVQVGEAINKSGIDRKTLFLTTKISRKELKSNSIVDSIENSLRVMNQDYIDLVLLHEPIDFLQNWKLLCEYFNNQTQIKVRHIGVSNFNIEQLELITKIKFPYCNQIELNPFLQRTSLTEYCKKKNILVVAHSPLAKGEKLDNPILKSISKDINKTPSQIMLKWNYINNNIIIPRSKDQLHILENTSLDFELSKDNLEKLDSLNCNYSTHPKYL